MVALLNPTARRESDAQSDARDRRVFPRREVHDTVEGHRLDHRIDARQQPRVQLDLRDISLGGLSAISDRAVEIGEHISVIFPPHGLLTRWDASGRVLRCDPSGLGYRVALEFDPMLAA